MMEIMERRFRWTLRQVLATIAETERAAADPEARGRTVPPDFVATRLAGLKFFFTALDAAIGSFTQGKPVDAETLQNVVPFLATKARQRR
jgi:hypothetical protein